MTEHQIDLGEHRRPSNDSGGSWIQIQMYGLVLQVGVLKSCVCWYTSLVSRRCSRLPFRKAMKQIQQKCGMMNLLNLSKRHFCNLTIFFCFRQENGYRYCCECEVNSRAVQNPHNLPQQASKMPPLKMNGVSTAKIAYDGLRQVTYGADLRSSEGPALPWPLLKARLPRQPTIFVVLPPASAGDSGPFTRILAVTF